MDLAKSFKDHAQEKSTLPELPYKPAERPTYDDLEPELRNVYDLFELIVKNQGDVSHDNKHQFAHCLYSHVNVYISLYDLRPMGGHTAHFSVCMYDKDGRIYDADKTKAEDIRYKVDADIKNKDGYPERVIDGELYKSTDEVMKEAVKWVGSLCKPNSQKVGNIYSALVRKQISMMP